MRYFLYSTFLWVTFVLTAQQKTNFYADVQVYMNKIPLNEGQTPKSIVSYIKKHEKKEVLQIKAAYYYVINLVSYDVFFEFTTNSNFTEEEYVIHTLHTKKGVCMHYAYLFQALVKELGFESTFVSGLVKQNQKISELSHAWNAVKFPDGKWYFFDPTWDSGSVYGQKFISKIQSKYYKVAPENFILTHYPFDYSNQFLDFPLSESDFLENKSTSSMFKEKFDFNAAYEIKKKNSKEQEYEALLKRLTFQGYKHKLSMDYYKLIQNNSASFSINRNIEKLRIIEKNYNSGIEAINVFIAYKNTQFYPEKEDKVILKMIQEPISIFEKCLDDCYQLGFVGQDNLYYFTKFKQKLVDDINTAKEHERFVLKYIETVNKRDRKKMFIKKK